MLLAGFNGMLSFYVYVFAGNGPLFAKFNGKLIIAGEDI